MIRGGCNCLYVTKVRQLSQARLERASYGSYGTVQ